MPDLRQAPPPRYRVVERDRRLVVIDTLGEPSSATPSIAPSTTWSPRQLQFDGSSELVTHPFYDYKAPRTIRLDPGSTAALGRFKLVAVFVAFALILIAITQVWLLLPLGAIVLNAKLRARVRAAITRWLDRIEQEAS